jgi:hypothetical protein
MSWGHTKEKQHQQMLEYQVERGLETLGLMTSRAQYDDPKRLTLTLSRYKFAAKIATGIQSCSFRVSGHWRRFRPDSALPSIAPASMLRLRSVDSNAG